MVYGRPRAIFFAGAVAGIDDWGSEPARAEGSSESASTAPSMSRGSPRTTFNDRKAASAANASDRIGPLPTLINEPPGTAKASLLRLSRSLLAHENGCRFGSIRRSSPSAFPVASSGGSISVAAPDCPSVAAPVCGAAQKCTALVRLKPDTTDAFSTSLARGFGSVRLQADVNRNLFPLRHGGCSICLSRSGEQCRGLSCLRLPITETREAIACHRRMDSTAEPS
jgi:hypothetical protein